MTITGITSPIVPAQLPAKAVVPGAEKTAPDIQRSVEDPRRVWAKAFYTRETEPWIKGSSKSEMTPDERATAKEMYLDELTRNSYAELAFQDRHYGKVRNELGVYRPELASKNFSYTLGDDGKVKVLDPDNSFTENELKYLTSLLNEDKNFTKSVTRHAKMAMALVDHDDKAFGGKYQLDILNIQNTLDYRKLLMSNPEKMRDAFIQQIRENGEKRKEPIVDIVA